jgi:MFS family permease
LNYHHYQKRRRQKILFDQVSLSKRLYIFSFLQGIANGIWGFLSIFMLHIGGSAIDIGILATVPGLVSTLMQLAWGRISDKLGKNWRMASIDFFMTSILSIPILLASHPWQIIIASGIQVFLGSISGVTVTLRLSEILEPSRRSRFMGIYNPMGFAGNIMGSFLTGLLLPVISYPTLLGYTLVNLLIVGLIRFCLQESDEESFSFTHILRISLLELWSGLRELSSVAKQGGAYTIWCLGISIRGFGIAMFGPISTIFLVKIILATEPQIGTLNSIAFAMRLLWAPLLGWNANRYGVKRVMLVGFALASIYPFTFAMAKDFTQLIPVYILNGIFWAFINSAWFAWQMNLIPMEKGKYIGFFNFLNGLAWAFGPLLGVISQKQLTSTTQQFFPQY